MSPTATLPDPLQRFDDCLDEHPGALAAVLVLVPVAVSLALAAVTSPSPSAALVRGATFGVAFAAVTLLLRSLRA